LNLVTVGLVLSLPTGRARAQAVLDVAQVTVSFWPEFDQPRVLVIYRVLLAPGTRLPAQVSVPVPSSVSTLNAVASRGLDGSLINADYSQSTEGETHWVLIQSTELELQLEFYTPLVRSGDLRSFSFAWPGGLAAGEFVFEAQEPIGVTTFDMTPEPASEEIGEYGLRYRRLNLGRLELASAPQLEISYTRSSEQMSAELLQVATPAGPPGSAFGQPAPLAPNLAWPLLAVGLLLVAGSGGYLLWKRRSVRPKARRRHRAAAETEAGEPQAAVVYCHNCGTAAGSRDRFCRRCGTALRR
jgi:hypothetical protein